MNAPSRLPSIRPHGKVQAADKERLMHEWNRRLKKDGLGVIHSTWDTWYHGLSDSPEAKLEHRADPIEFDHDELEDECSGMSYGAAYVHSVESVRAEYGNRESEDDMATPTSQFQEGHADRARRYGGLATLTLAQWTHVLSAFDDACAYCGSRDAITMDHVEPLSHGGDHAIWNVVPACWPCNISKGAHDLEEWCRMGTLEHAEIEARIAKAHALLSDRLGADSMRPSCRARRT